MNGAVRIERRGGTALLILGAPERRNALNATLATEMVRLCDELDGDASVGCVVVYGEGYFSAGGDRAELALAGEDPTEPDRFTALGSVYRAFTRVGELQAPTIAAVVGGAVGAGMNLLLATDLRVVAQDARLLSGFARIGIHPGGGHLGLMARHAGLEAAAAMGLFGAEIDGRRAAELGLAWAAVPADQVLDTALALAEVPAADPELARRTAQSLRLSVGPPGIPWAAALELERTSQMWSMRRKALRE
jgi:enoyl-CoA hydratase